ncbi:MAG TPA: autotransporter outer membrane beta-barrel domain-containing protein [Sphingomonas sp.]|jgi:hypothetical protein
MSRARQVRMRALGTSAMTLAALLAGSAFAQCAPEPTAENGTTVCRGIDADGLQISTYGTAVTVEQDAIVRSANAPALAVRLGSSNGFGAPVRIDVFGLVDGGTHAGISQIAQPIAESFSTQTLALTIAAGGTVTGSNGVVVGRAAGQGFVDASVTIDNAGMIEGTSGIALLSTDPANGFSSIVNRAGGVIGAIVGPIGSLDNAGTIDGGVRSAIERSSRASGFFFGSVVNSGSIVSNSSSATYVNLTDLGGVTNSGTIENSGVGLALAGSSFFITNAAGGRIASAGAIAIQTDTLQLTNAGTIVGDVIVGSTASFSFSTVDTTLGSIDGSLRFGAGNDTLIARYDNGALRYGVTGTIDGGDGIDMVRARFASDTTLAAPLVVPTNFERLALTPAAGVTTALSPGFVAPGILLLGGEGTLINRATLSGTGQIIIDDFQAGGLPNFVNAGTIASSSDATGFYAVAFNQFGRFENSGTITATRDAVSLFGSGPIVNSGTIIAGGTGLSTFSGQFDNTGLIRSTDGIGAILNGSTFGTTTVNAGRIEGMTAGVQLGAGLANTGTITGSQAGIVLTGYGTLENRAGGVVSGGTAAITAQFPNASFYSFNTTVTNGGTINGNVVLGDSQTLVYGNNNRYFALTGGILNGDLLLGQGDLFVTELANAGPGTFAGINGDVIANASQLRYRVRQDATAVSSAPAGFANVGYDLFDGATLTLTGTGGTPLTLAGRGTVDVTANITTSTGPAISRTNLSLAPGETGTDGALAITSRGTLTLTRTDTNIFPGAAVTLGGDDSFTNTGTIVVTDQASPVFNQFAAISGGFTSSFNGGTVVTNSGSIILDGTVGILGARTITNSGSIVQASGGRAATGLRITRTFGATLVNSGTIDVGGAAVETDFYRAAVDNSGRLASSGTAAITGYANITNRAGGTIAGGAGQAIQVSGGSLVNAGTITGTVDLGYFSSSRSFSSATYVADGGTIAGDLRFGEGSDTIIAYADDLGVSGTIDGGGGLDTFVQARRASGTVTLGRALPVGFESEGVRTLGADTVVTIRADAPVGTISVAGDGAIVNTADITGAVRVGTGNTFDDPAPLPEGSVLAAFTNTATIGSGFSGETRSFTNSGTIGTDTLRGSAIDIGSRGAIAFGNQGRIGNAGAFPAAVNLSGVDAVTIRNDGTITGGGLSASAYGVAGVDVSVTLANTGTITGSGAAVSMRADRPLDGTAIVRLDNSGTIDAAGAAGSATILSGVGDAGRTTIVVTNSGTLRANGGGVRYNLFDPYAGASVPSSFVYTSAASALVLSDFAGGTSQVVNAASGTIEATGTRSVAINALGASLDLANAGTIRGGSGTILTADDGLIYRTGRAYLAGAIQAGTGNDRVVNTGTIVGSIDLGTGDDQMENRGRTEGDVFLGAGDDSFVQQASAFLVGTVDGGDGSDSLTVDASGGGNVDGDRFVRFERFSQIGQGNVTYTGNFRYDTIGQSGGTITVAAGRTLSSDGSTTVTGSGAGETVVNDGTITGTVDLGGGDDRVVNRGAVGGSVLLGAGHDSYVEGPNSRVAGVVDGGTGTDTYAVALVGDRTGIGQGTSFERLSIEGGGILTLALGQNYQATSLAGVGLNVTMNGFGLGQVTGSDGVEQLTTDGDIASIALGAADDLLSLDATRAAGVYSGGAGSDLLRFIASGPLALTGTASEFERVQLVGQVLTVAGTLGSAGGFTSFDDAAQAVTVASGGTLAGVIDLGAGDDTFRLSAGGTIAGTIAGDAGNDTATVELAGDRALAGTTGFETLATEGVGTLTLTGTHRYDQVLTTADLGIAADGVLAARQVAFGAGNQRFTVAGRFEGSVAGGNGTDTITVSGGGAAAPVAFTDIATVETLQMTGGYATIGGRVALNSVDMSNGRLVGLAGSTLTAARITVGRDATFGSAGIVNGDLAVAGTLSPGASPGTMTVNGNIALASGSISLFELTPTISDKLIVNGALSIASGATLQLTSTGALRPGTSYDLIIANAGITGSYTIVRKPDTLFGFIVQRADRIQLLGQFLGNAGFSPQVSRSIAYANATLAVQPATSTLFSALPSLLTANGASNPQAFAQLTPEAYASATQIGIENALAVTDVARGPGFAADRTTPGGFTFAQGFGSWYRLAGDPTQGVSSTRTSSYGFLGGVGYGDRDWSVGAFGGYLNSQQRIHALGARTGADGFIAGAQGRYQASGFGFGASIVYNGAKADTRRALPGATNAIGRYDLDSWVSDVSVHYTLDMGGDWTLRPRAGVTYLRTTRERVVEAGGPLALTVARDQHVAGFADGGFTFGRSDASDAAFRLLVGLGMRYQIERRRIDALASYAGGGLGLEALGATRTRAVGTATAGIAYRLTTGLDLFSTVSAQTGRDDHRESVSTGVRLRF